MFNVGLQVQIKSSQSKQFSVPPSTVRCRPRTMELTPILVPRTRCGFLAPYSFGFIFLGECILPRYSTLPCGDLDFTLASSFLLIVTWCDPTSLKTFISDYQTLFYVKKADGRDTQILGLNIITGNLYGLFTVECMFIVNSFVLSYLFVGKEM